MGSTAWTLLVLVIGSMPREASPLCVGSNSSVALGCFHYHTIQEITASEDAAFCKETCPPFYCLLNPPISRRTPRYHRRVNRIGTGCGNPRSGGLSDCHPISPVSAAEAHHGHILPCPPVLDPVQTH